MNTVRQPNEPIPIDQKQLRLLDQHRRDIEALDRRILHLVCERLELARQVGDLKRRCNVPLRNFEVEAQIHRRFEEASSFLGLEAELGHDLALFLIEKSVEEQATLLDSVYRGDQLRAVVVGGKGGMGSWMARLLNGQGHTVSILDPAPGETLFPEVSDLAEGVNNADLVVLAVPMTGTATLLDELARLKPRGVVAEMCSLKGHLQPQIARLRSDGLRLVSFHPLFGPGVRMLSGKTVIFCSDAETADLALVRGLFEATSAEMVEMDVAEHDRCMAVVLGLTHLSNLSFARALQASGVSARDLTQVAGVTFSRQLETTREVTEENPDLYFQIQALNSITDDTAQWLTEAVGEWRETVAQGDGLAFTRLMRSCHDYLGGAGENGQPAATSPSTQ